MCPYLLVLFPILHQVQTIATEGASDVISLVAPNGVQYVVIANREDNNGSPNTDSLVLQWSQGRFVLFQSLATIGASAVDVVSVGSTQFIVFSSFTDTRCFSSYTCKLCVGALALPYFLPCYSLWLVYPYISCARSIQWVV